MKNHFVSLGTARKVQKISATILATMFDIERHQWNFSQYASQFREANVVESYPCRPPYPAETFDIVADLGANASATVLDLGTGTGEIARNLAPRVHHVDAIDISKPMIELGQSLPGGNAANLNWIAESVESHPFRQKYEMVIAAESIQWTNWNNLFAKMKSRLAANGYFVLIECTCHEPLPENEIKPLLLEYTRFVTHFDVVEALQAMKLWKMTDYRETRMVQFSQTPQEYINSIHSRCGCSRQIMGKKHAAEFDREIMTLLRNYSVKKTVNFKIGARVFWGRLL